METAFEIGNLLNCKQLTFPSFAEGAAETLVLPKSEVKRHEWVGEKNENGGCSAFVEPSWSLGSALHACAYETF
ncbi:hypothetical protein NPIL_56051 [Nephila pilipes]|uniref:Uncharacterized protein n=1 Tax=Nephila pilipes TaxID=299642 RepID=A0A8X6NX25_NEPPI|nr:hypothetical protein NPIL_56051 [Nephila pilipes]